MPVVRRGEAAADVENLDLVSAFPALLHHCRRRVERLNEILKVGALTADVEAQALDHQTQVKGGDDQIHGLAWIAAELGGEFDHRAGVGHAQAQDQAGVRGELFDFL